MGMQRKSEDDDNFPNNEGCVYYTLCMGLFITERARQAGEY